MFASALMFGSIVTTSISSVKANADAIQEEQQANTVNDDEYSIEITNSEEFDKLASIDDQDDFNYELAAYLQDNGVDPEQVSGLVKVRTPRGKATLAAKAAGKAMKAFLKKMGKAWWEKQSKKWYFPVKVNWKTINKIADFTSQFNGTVEDAITSFLTSNHIANQKVAKGVAKVIVFIFF